MNKKSSVAPSVLLMALEARAPLEWASHWLLRHRMKDWPQGDGHPVLVLPGLATNDVATAPMRDMLKVLGYKVYPWDEGFNTGPSPELLNKLASRVVGLSNEHDQPISIIGWSLGGVIARGLAADYPKKIRSVITMGSPIAYVPASNLEGLFELLSGMSSKDESPHEWVRRPTSVPVTSIISKGDGLVDWQSGVVPPSATQETVEVLGVSHMGLPMHPAVMWVVADRLRQESGKWKPFVSPSGISGLWSSPHNAKAFSGP
jgi:pimeloyl-ACP methyl ester carboxylesterase